MSPLSTSVTSDALHLSASSSQEATETSLASSRCVTAKIVSPVLPFFIPRTVNLSVRSLRSLRSFSRWGRSLLILKFIRTNYLISLFLRLYSLICRSLIMSLKGRVQICTRRIAYIVFCILKMLGYWWIIPSQTVFCPFSGSKS